jgi:uncharacterized membrane protein
MNESHFISLIKAITYRLLGSFITFIGSFLFTKKITLSLGIAVFDFFFKILLYYIHERIWLFYIKKHKYT